MDEFRGSSSPYRRGFDVEGGGRASSYSDDDDVSDPFNISSTKNASIERLKRWRYEVELVSWMSIVDVCKDGGIINKLSKKGERGRQPSDLDEVLVKYQVMLHDGTIVSETTEEGTKFYINDGHLIPALPRVIKTMTMGEKASLIVQPQSSHGINV